MYTVVLALMGVLLVIFITSRDGYYGWNTHYK